ncbi:MAG: ABC transporter ATP-binding protein [Pseudanabaenaceae cyanobacterium]|jgi:ATP-binding cassette subfamily B multidrug efflux pump
MARSPLRNLIQYLKPHYGPLALGTVALFLANALGTYIPWLIKVAVDALKQLDPGQIALNGVSSTNGISLNAIGQTMNYVWLIIGLSSLMWIVRIMSRIWIFGIGRSVEFDLKQQVFEHLLILPPSYFARKSAGEVISIVTSDVENVRRLMGFALLSIINSIFVYSMTIPAMLLIDPMLTLAAISVYPFMLMLVKSFGAQLRDEQMHVQEQLAEVSTLLQEDLNGIALIKTYAQEQNERKAFNQLNEVLFEANLALAKSRNVLFPLLGGIASVSFLVLVWFGGEKLAQPNTTFKVGDLLSLIIYVERLIFPTAILGFTLTTYQRGQVSIKRIQEILEIPPAVVDAPESVALTKAKPESNTELIQNSAARVLEVSGKIEVRDLSFTYENQSAPTLRNLNFTIMPGERVAMIGTVGAGKTTLASVLLRLVDTPQNALFLDGVDITDIRINDLRRHIAFVPQDSFLFSATMADNIRYGRPEASMAEVEYYASQARIQSEILNFPLKYETIVGERGITLSGGQRQRTALARALLMDAPILILDDALSSVDNQTAVSILNNFPEAKTVLFITHNLSAAATCDRILVMDQGEIIAAGTHEHLLATAPLYQKLWNQHNLEAAVR